MGYRFRVVLLIFVFVSLFYGQLLGQLARGTQQIPIGNSDFNGFVRVDHMLSRITFSDGTIADLFLKFSTNPTSEKKYLGRFWSIPFFESHIKEISSQKIIWKTPSNNFLVFKKDTIASKKERKNIYILSTNESWRLEQQNKDIIITHKLDCERKFLYKNGRLIRFSTGKNGDTIDIKYNKEFPIALLNTTKNELILSCTYKNNLISSIHILPASKNIFIEYTKLASNANLTEYLITGLNFSYQSPLYFKYKWNLKQEKRKILTNYGLEVVSIPVNLFTQYTTHQKFEITWDNSTGLIVADSNGAYALQTPLVDQHAPEYNTTEIKNARSRNRLAYKSLIEYYRKDTPYPEVWGYDTVNLIKIRQNPYDGIKQRISFIGRHGNLYMKVRKIEQQHPHSTWQMLSSNFYNNDGRLIRSIDSQGNITEYNYSNLDLTRIIKNGETIFERVCNIDNSFLETQRSPNKYIQKYIKDNLIVENIQSGISNTTVYKKDGIIRSFKSNINHEN